jgi:hypothetical protein
MPKFIMLNGADKGKVVVDIEKITYMAIEHSIKGPTGIYFAADDRYARVRETPEEVLELIESKFE